MAANNGNLALVKWLTHNGSFVIDRDNDGNTCLLKAITSENLKSNSERFSKLIKWLLKNGSSEKERNNKKETCLFYAFHKKDIKLLKFMKNLGFSLFSLKIH